jgi:hypothetical protein
LNIANFVIIDDDNKIRQELVRYIRELNSESTILEFVSSNEFEHRFLLPLAHAATTTMKKAFNPLEAFNPEQVKKINELTLSKKEPFPGDILSLELKKSDFGVIKTNLSTGEVFGEEVVKTFNGNASLEKFLIGDFKTSLDTFKKKLEGATEDIATSIVVKGTADQIWILEIVGHFKGDIGQFQLRNKTYETLRLIGKDEKKNEEETVKPQIIDVFIFRGDCVAEKDLAKWVNKIAAVTKKLKLWPENNRPKFIATKFEDDKKEKAEFNHPLIDDLFCLPFDRLIILQKLELVLALPEKATPSYLFVQEIKQNLEVAKKVNIEKFSDLGFAMVNPVPLDIDTPGHFYFRFPGQKLLIDVHGRVTHCLPHPEKPKEFLAYFSFFGLTRNALKEIRAYLSRDSGYKMHINQKNDDFEFNPDNIFLTEDQKIIKNVAVVDPDEKTLENINSILRKDIGGIHVTTDSSYFNFFRNYLSTPTEKTPPAVPEDFYSSMLSYLVGVGDLNLQMCLSPPDAEQKLFGYDANQIFATPQGWLDLFKNETSRNLMNESIYLVQTQSRLKRSIDVTNSEGKLKSVLIEFVLEENKKIVRINMVPPAKAEVRNFEKLKSLDALIIDRRAISSEIPAFINSLNEALTKESINTPPGGPKVIIMCDEQPVEEIENILSFKVSGLIFKPLEVKRVCYTLSNLLNIPFTIHNFNNIGWKTDHIPAKLARDSHMIELSEFGATLQMNQKLRVGTMFYLFRGIFKNAPDQNLCCRVYHSVENEGEEGGFLNYVSYFGITDAFLKFTRTYIRETYAGNKAKENSSEGQ